MSNSENLPQELQAAEQMIARIRAEASAGNSIDLAPLEARVEILCQTVEDLPAEQARQLRVSLLALLEDFDLLAKQLKTNLVQLTEQLGAATERRRAALAYSNKADR